MASQRHQFLQVQDCGAKENEPGVAEKMLPLEKVALFNSAGLNVCKLWVRMRVMVPLSLSEVRSLAACCKQSGIYHIHCNHCIVLSSKLGSNDQGDF